MKEVIESPYPNSNEVIQLPSKLRIKQRLGHVSTSKHFKEQVVPKLARIGGEAITVDSFLDNLGTALFTRPESSPDTSLLRENQAPKIVHQIIQDPQLEERMMQQWHEGRVDGMYQNLLPTTKQEIEALQALPVLEEVE